MARSYPRFLYSNPQNTKSEGPFIVHLLNPHFICRILNVTENVSKNALYNLDSGDFILELLEVFKSKEEIEYTSVINAMRDMAEWIKNQDFQSKNVLSKEEFVERERLLQLQKSNTRWFTQQEFDRLKELNNKLFSNAGSPYKAD